MSTHQFSVTAVSCFLVFIAVTNYTGSDVTDDVTENPWSPAGRDQLCPSCPSHEVLHQLPQADVVRLHVERIKRELLRKLGISTPPNVTGRFLPSVHSLPRPLLSIGAGNSVTGEDGVFPDDDEDNYATAMSDDVASASRRHGDYYYNDDDDNDYENEDYDDTENDDDDELDYNHYDLGRPLPPPRSKQIIVFGEQSMSTIYYFETACIAQGRLSQL